MSKGKIISYGEITIGKDPEDYIIYYKNGKSYLETTEKKYELSNTPKKEFHELPYQNIKGKILNTISNSPIKNFKFKGQNYKGVFKNKDSDPFNQQIKKVINSLPTLTDEILPLSYISFFQDMSKTLESFETKKHTYLGLYPFIDQLQNFLMNNFKLNPSLSLKRNLLFASRAQDYFYVLEKKVLNFFLKKLLLLLLLKIKDQITHDTDIFESLSTKNSFNNTKIKNIINILKDENLEYIEPFQNENILTDFFNNFDSFEQDQLEKLSKYYYDKQDNLSIVESIIYRLVSIHLLMKKRKQTKFLNKKNETQLKLELRSKISSLIGKEDYFNIAHDVDVWNQIAKNKNLIDSLVKSNNINNKKEIELIFLVKLIDTIKSSNTSNKEQKLKQLKEKIEFNPLFDVDNREDMIRYINK